VAFASRDKWGEVALDAGLVVLGTLLVLAAGSELSGGEPVGLLVVVLFTAYAVATTVVLACVAAATSQLPTLDEARIGGERALAVRSWPASWWHSALLDLGLAAAGLALAAAGASAGGDWGIVAVILGLVGLWFLVRVALVVSGRRRRPGLWLTDDEVVVDARAGRARVGRASVRRVSARGRRLVVVLDHDAAWDLCPRPWRSALGRLDVLVLDCTEIGHRADDLAAWLATELGIGRPREVRNTPGRA